MEGLDRIQSQRYLRLPLFPRVTDDRDRRALPDRLRRGGISDPAEALKNIRDMALRFEASNPEIANHIRDGLAVLRGASSELVARVHSWFDQSINGVSERFTHYVHAVVERVVD